MNIQIKHILTSLLIFSSFFLFSQTKYERQKIVATYNINKLRLLKNKFDKEFKANQITTNHLAQQHNWVFKKEKNGNLIELVGVDKDNNPIYYTTYNINAVISTRTNTLHNGGLLGLNLEGQNMTTHIWDEGLARITHQEYDGIGGSNRYSIGDNSTDLSSHSSHVTGTIISSGVQPNAKGMAPQANAIGYDWFNDLSEVTSAASNGMLVSNHSYGREATTLQDKYFGYYSYKSKYWDQIAYNTPFYLMVVSAGNDGLDSSSNGNPIEGNSDYDKLSDAKTAKNNLVVANAQDANIDTNGNLISVQIHPTSSQGPTDDYRIKPDITGNGTELYSTIETSDNSYDTLTGTSMATPNVSGTLLLLQQHYNNINGNYMKASTLKGLVLHTADDIGIIGPDAIYGWGLLNAKKATNTITNNGSTTIIKELTLHQGQSYQFAVDADGINDLIASISWTDPEGFVYSYGATNNDSPKLINDLDIRISQNATVFEPYKLTSVNTNATGDNIVDPYEKIIVNGASGSYNITITHKGELTNDVQNFSLIITGKLENTNCIATQPNILNVSNITNNEAFISWSTIEYSTYELRYKEIASSTWQYTTFSDSFGLLTGLNIASNYEVQVKSICADNSNSNFSTSYYFTTDTIGYCPPQIEVGYLDDFENEVIPNIDSCWGLLGNGYFRSINSYSSNHKIISIPPTINNSTNVLVSPFLSGFDSNKRISIKSNKNITIGTLSDNSDINTFTPYQRFDNSEDVYNAPMKEIHFDFANYTGTDNYIGIKYDGDSYAYIDDFYYQDSPNCIEPKLLTNIEALQTSVEINWIDESNASEWLIEYGPEGFTLGEGTQASVNSNPYIVFGLTPNSTYDFYIKTVCGSTQSEWSYPITISTLCGMITPYINTFDTVEERDLFENCWSNIDSDFSTSNVSLILSRNVKLISPQVLDFDSNKRIKFWLHTNIASENNLVIGTMSNPNDISTFTPYQTIEVEDFNTSEYKYFIIDFKYYAGTDQYIVLKEGNENYYSCYINEFVYEETPSCIEVANIEVNVLSETEIEVNWTELGDASEWEIEYGLSGFTLGDGTIVNTSSTSYIIDNLEHSTFYDIYVRAKCSETDKSNWMPVITKQTNCGAQDAGYIQEFNDFSDVINTCWHFYEDPDVNYSGIGSSTESINSNSFSCKIIKDNNNDVVYISPVLNNINTANKRLKFWLKKGNSYSNSQVEIGTTSSLDSFDNLHPFDTFNFSILNRVDWKQFTYNLDDYTSYLDERFYIRIIGYGHAELFFDFFEYDEIPNCTKPELYIDTYQNNNLSLSWDDFNNSTSWELAYSTNNESIYDATIIPLNTNSYSIDNLNNNTLYKFWVRSICDTNNKSDFSEPIIITGGCGDSFEQIYTQDFNNSNIDSCWHLYRSSNSIHINASISNLDINDNGHSVRLKSSSSYYYGDAYLVSPIFTDMEPDRQVRFFMKANPSGPSSARVSVGTISDPINFNTFSNIESVTVPNDNQWHEKIIYLNRVDNNDSYIAIKTNTDFNSTDTLIDDFSYEIGPTCGSIQNLHVADLTDSSATISWLPSDDNETTWQISRFPRFYNNTITTTEPSYAFENLSLHLYTYYVRGVCDESLSLYSRWKKITFTPTCGNVTTDYEQYFSGGYQTYDHPNIIPPCWSSILPNGHGTNTMVDNVAIGNGNKFIRMNIRDLNESVYLASPQFIDFSNNKRINFDLLPNYKYSTFTIGTMSDPTDKNSFVPYKIFQKEELIYNQYQNITIDFKDYLGTDKYIAFKLSLGNEIHYSNEEIINLDNFHYIESPNCIPPSNLTHNSIASNAVTLYWNEHNNSNEWSIEYGESGFELGTGNTVTVYTNPYTIVNLEPNTKYDFYVKSNCNNIDYSNKWSATTSCGTYLADYVQNYDALNNDYFGIPININKCWSIFGSVQAGDWSSYSINTPSLPNSVRLMNDFPFLISPEFSDFDNNKKIELDVALSINSNLIIGTLSDPNNIDTFIPYKTIYADEIESGFNHIIIDFNEYIGTDKFIGITREDGRDRPYDPIGQPIFIDNFEYLQTTCAIPTNIHANFISNNSAHIYWTENEQNAFYDIQYGIEGFEIGTGTILTNLNNEVDFTNLFPSTNYDYYIRTSCDESNKSYWVGPFIFKTACSSFTAPYNYNFNIDNDTDPETENGTINSCWKGVFKHIHNEEENSLIYVKNGKVMMEHGYNYLLESNGYIVSPYFSDLNNNKIISFHAGKTSWDILNETSPLDLVIGTMSNPLEPSTFTPYKTFVNAEFEDTDEFYVNFNNYTGNDNYIAFKILYHDSTFSFYLTDFEYKEASNCEFPTNISVNQYTDTTANIIWNNNNTTTNFNLEYGAIGFTQGTGTIISVNENTSTIEGLQPSTSYSYYLRANCNNSNSEWRGPFNFTTNNVPFELPWFEGFENLPSLGQNNLPDGIITQNMYSTDLVFDDEMQQKYPMWAYDGDNYIAGTLYDKLWVITPSFNLEGGNTYFFDFKFLYQDPIGHGNNFDNRQVIIFCINGNNFNDPKYLLNMQNSYFHSYYYNTYINSSQSFTPQLSGQYSFAVYFNGVTSTNGPNEICIDNLSVSNIYENTILSQNLEDFEDNQYNGVGIYNGINARTLIDDELIFTSISSNNWVANTNKSDNSNIWLDNPSYISTLKMIVDATINPLTTLNFKLKQRYHENINESQFRVLVNGNQIGNTYQPISTYDSYQNISLDLSAYNGQIYTIELQAIGKNNKVDFSYGQGDETYLDDVQIILNNSASINDTLFTNLNYYPNPTNDKFYLTSDNKIEKVEIYNMLGQHIFLKKYNEYKVILNFTNYENAIYFVNVYIKGVKKTIKVIVKN